MEKIVEYLVANVSKDPADFEVTTEKESERTTIIYINVKKDDMGKVIGHNGKVINAIRNIVKSMTLKTNLRYIVKVAEKKEA